MPEGKMRAMRMSKQMSLAEAASLVPPRGASLAFGGITLYRRPMAFALALLARHQQDTEPANLRLWSFTAGVESDLLIGAGMVEEVHTCYFGLEIFGLAPNFTTAASRGRIRIIEETEASFAYGLRAGMAGVGFMPSTAWQGTDLLKLRPDVRTIEDPYTGERLTAFPAIHVDLAAVHALEADHAGNARLGGNQGVDRELTLVADMVIVTAEKVVPALDQADILGTVVTAVVEAPQGAWPTSCHPYYPLDGEAILGYIEHASQEGFSEILDGWYTRHGIRSS